MAGQEQHFTSWPENRTRQELEARSIQLILAQCRDPKGAGVAQRKQQTKFITSESGTLRHPLLEYPAHDPVFGLLLPFSTLNLTQNGPKQGVPTRMHVPAFTPFGSPPAIAPGLSSFQLHQFLQETLEFQEHVLVHFTGLHSIERMAATLMQRDFFSRDRCLS